MKVPAYTFYLPVFILLLLLQLYLPSFKANVFIQMAALLAFALTENLRFSVQFLRQIMPLVVLLLLGFVGTVLHRYKMYDVLKDVFHFIKPIVGILAGYIVARQVNNQRVFTKGVVVAAVLSAIIHFLIIIFLVRSISTVEGIRMYTKDNFLDLFGLFILIYYKKMSGEELITHKWYRRICIVLLALSCVLYFSRTMIILAVLLLTAVYGYTKIKRSTIVFFGIMAVATIALFTYLNTANIRRDGKGIEVFLFKLKMAPEEIFNTRIDRSNHAELWDHWRAYEAKRAILLMNTEPESYVYGTGYGSLVNLKFFAPLSGDAKGIRYISDLHNGYINVLYKLGFIGLIIYLSMLVRLYKYVNREFNFANIMVSSIAVIYLVTSVMITGMYNGRDIIVFILGGVLFYADASFKKTQINAE